MPKTSLKSWKNVVFCSFSISHAPSSSTTPFSGHTTPPPPLASPLKFRTAARTPRPVKKSSSFWRIVLSSSGAPSPSPSPRNFHSTSRQTMKVMTFLPPITKAHIITSARSLSES